MAEPRPVFDPDKMAVSAEAPAPSAGRVLTVSQLNLMIKNILGDHLPGTIYLVGEISNLSRAASGHLYLTLKDDQSEIRAVMWRSSASSLKFKPADGLEVVATGHVDVYEPRGQYQFYVRKLEPRGTGSLELAFRQLHDRLNREGLFDAANKKRLPRYPQRIAVVTSPTGAAIRDIIKTLKRRWACATVMLHPVRVQGEGAADEIAAAIRRLNAQADRLGGIDLMIVGRGGGSLEDLWAFNEEVVARAIFDSRIPIIAGIGHEVDVTIADLVADLRAPTPTAAAELAAPVLDEVLDGLSAHADRLRRATRHGIDLARSRLATAERFAWFRDPSSAVGRYGQQLDDVVSRLRLSWAHRLADVRRRLHQAEVVLAAIQPQAFVQHQRGRLLDVGHRLRWVLGQRTRQAERQVERWRRALLVTSPRMRAEAGGEKVEQLLLRLKRAMDQRLSVMIEKVDVFETRLDSTSYRRTLARGFTITRARDSREIITRPGQVAPGQHISTETAEGEFASRVVAPQDG